MLKRISLFMFSAALVSSSWAQNALRGGFVESADVMYFVDVEAMNNSAFMQAVEDQQPAEQKAQSKANLKKFTEATGLTEEDVTHLVVSMNLEGVGFDNPQPALLEKADGILALSLKKPISRDQLKAALDAMGEDSPNPMKSSLATVDGLDVVRLESAAPQENGPDEAYATLADGGKVVLMAFRTSSLKNGIARIESGTMEEPDADMATAMKSIENRDVRGVVVLPPEARRKIQEGANAAAAQGGMGAMVAPFATAKSLIVSANTSDSLDLFLSLDLGNNANATQAAGMLQSMLPMMMMQFGQQLGPKAMQISQKVNIAPRESVVTMSLNLTAEDITPAP